MQGSSLLKRRDGKSCNVCEGMEGARSLGALRLTLRLGRDSPVGKCETSANETCMLRGGRAVATDLHRDGGRKTLERHIEIMLL